MAKEKIYNREIRLSLYGTRWTLSRFRLSKHIGNCRILSIIWRWVPFGPEFNRSSSTPHAIQVSGDLFLTRWSRNKNHRPFEDDIYKIVSRTMIDLTHWGRVTHICVGNLTIIGSDNGLSPGRRRAIIWTNAGILLIWPLGTNSSEILIGIQTFSFTKLHLKTSSAKWRPFCLGLNVLMLTAFSNVTCER